MSTPNLQHAITASVFRATEGFTALPTYAIDKMCRICQVFSEGDKLGELLSAIQPDVSPDVMKQEYLATVSSIIPALEAFPEWSGIDVSRSDEPSIKICANVSFKGEWSLEMQDSDIAFHNPDGSVVEFAPAMYVEEPSQHHDVDGSITYEFVTYLHSVVFTMYYYGTGAKMQFIQPKDSVNIVSPPDVGIYQTIFGEIDREEIKGCFIPQGVWIPCFKMTEQRISLMDHLQEFPSLFNKDGTFLRKLLTDPKTVAYVEKFDVTMNLDVNPKGTDFSAMMEFDVGIDRCCGDFNKKDFKLDSAFLYRALDRNNTVLLSGIVKKL